MLFTILILVFAATILFIFGAVPKKHLETRPRLQILDAETQTPQKKTPRRLLKRLVSFNKPLCIGPVGRRINNDLAIAKVDVSAEEFLFIKEILITAAMTLAFVFSASDLKILWIAFGFVAGFMLPEVWLKKKIKKVKSAIEKELPDVIDLLGLCVNAGLDFMLALKWVIEKSTSSILIDEMRLIMQEINVGKSRRAALSDLAKKYELPDLATFSRTLIQADRMGTSVAEALNILSEDMRLSRYRRGEQIALKAPLKMLFPLLFCIFPVVAILVGGPILVEFTHKNLFDEATKSAPVFGTK